MRRAFWGWCNGLCDPRRELRSDGSEGDNSVESQQGFWKVGRLVGEDAEERVVYERPVDDGASLQSPNSGL